MIVCYNGGRYVDYRAQMKSLCTPYDSC